MMCIRWGNKVKFLTAEALRGVTIFDAQGNRIDNELGKRDYVTGTALEQGCDLRQDSRGPSTRSSTSLSRCRGTNPVCQNAFSKPQRFHSQRNQKIVELPSGRSWRFTRNIMEVLQVGGFTRTWRFHSFSTQSRWSMTLLMPLVQFTEKLVEVTMIMRTSSGSPSISANSGDASDSDSGSGNSSEWVKTPTMQPTAPMGCRDDTGAVQGDEQYRERCRTSRKSRRLMRS